MTMIAANLENVRDRIQAASQRAGRNLQAVRLLAVSKTFGPDAVLQAAAAGQFAFGENYVQEAVEKIQFLGSLPGVPTLEWHCIGPIQSNKTRLVAEHFQWVHTVDRLKLAQRLSDQRPRHFPPLQVCIQVKVQGGNTKSGVAPDEALHLARAVAALPHVCLRGVMSIPDPLASERAQREVFAQVKAVFDDLCNHGMALDTLSMGMSGDMDAAILEGSTLVRVGSAIFGARAHANPAVA
jgi:pyridoxal phosphate enzyme (YggS family)